MQSNCPFKIIHVHFPSNVRASHKFTTKKFVEKATEHLAVQYLPVDYCGLLVMVA